MNLCFKLFALGLVAFPSLAAAQSPAQIASNKRVAIQFNADFFDGVNFERGVATLSDDFIEHHPTDGEPERSKAQVVAKFREMRLKHPAQPGRQAATPDMVMAQGDKVLLVFKQNKPYPKTPTETYEAFRFELYRVDHGKIVEHWDPATVTPAAAH